MTVDNKSARTRRYEKRLSDLDMSVRLSVQSIPAQGKTLRTRTVYTFNVVSHKKRTSQAPKRSNTRSPTQKLTVVRNNDLATTPTDWTSTSDATLSSSPSASVEVTGSMACTDGLSPSVRHFQGYNPQGQLERHLKLAHWQVSRPGQDGPSIKKVENGAIWRESILPLVTDILWPDMEWQEHLFLMMGRQISDPYVCIASYIRNGLLHAPRPNESDEACGNCFERRNACTCMEACSFCIDARRPCARLFIDDKDHKSVILLAGLPGRKSCVARGLTYLRLNKKLEDKGYFVQGL